MGNWSNIFGILKSFQDWKGTKSGQKGVKINGAPPSLSLILQITMLNTPDPYPGACVSTNKLQMLNKKMKHNKIKNTGILFELLTRQITADVLAGKSTKSVKIVKKYFNENTELGKELQL